MSRCYNSGPAGGIAQGCCLGNAQHAPEETHAIRLTNNWCAPVKTQPLSLQSLVSEPTCARDETHRY